ncbi:MAG: hypothetical protein GX434_18625 [Peptococcaceae bacterium]|nr:hypothetical protein [Peptococcaceae bacterium]
MKLQVYRWEWPSSSTWPSIGDGLKQVTVNMFKKISIKTRIGYIVDLLLLITMGYIIVSGIMISKVVFPNVSVQ